MTGFYMKRKTRLKWVNCLIMFSFQEKWTFGRHFEKSSFNS